MTFQSTFHASKGNYEIVKILYKNNGLWVWACFEFRKNEKGVRALSWFLEEPRGAKLAEAPAAIQ